MAMKAAAVIALVLVASLSVAGHLQTVLPTPTSPTVPTPVPTSTHNPILERAASKMTSVDTLDNPPQFFHYAKP